MKESAAYRRASGLLEAEAQMWRETAEEHASNREMRVVYFSVVRHLEGASRLLAGLAREAGDPDAVSCSECNGLFLKRTHNQKRCPVCRGEDYLRYRSELLSR